jgi:hypothetical protein
MGRLMVTFVSAGGPATAAMVDPGLEQLEGVEVGLDPGEREVEPGAGDDLPDDGPGLPGLDLSLSRLGFSVNPSSFM